MATFQEKAAHSVNRVFSLLSLFLAVVVRGQDFGSDCVSSWSLLTFYYLYVSISASKPAS